MAAWIAVVTAGEALLLALGGGDLATPPVAEPGAWAPWLVTRGTEVAVLALVRLGALWAGAYLLAVLVLGTATRALRARALIRAGDLVTPPSVRRLLDRATGMAAAGAVAVGSVAGVAPPAAAQGPPTSIHGPPITLRGLSGPRPDRGPTTTTTIGLPPVTAPAVEVATPPPEPVPPPVPPPQAEHPPPAVEGAPAPSPPLPAPQAAGDTWTVRRGDSFWTIAEAVLAEAWGQPPSAREVDPYWRALVEANRPRLVDGGNPDLLFAGQVLAVPPPPTRAA